MIGPGPRLGANLAPPGDVRSDALLFGESAARIVVSVRREHVQGLRAVAQRQGVAGGDHLTLQGRGFRLHLPVEAIYWAWGTGLSRSLK
jgi:hypothetical protein